MSKCQMCGQLVNDIRQYIYHQRGSCQKKPIPYKPNMYELIYGKKEVQQEPQAKKMTNKNFIQQEPPKRAEEPKLEEEEKKEEKKEEEEEKEEEENEEVKKVSCDGMRTCPLCNKRFKNRGFNKHYNFCINKYL